MTDRIEKTIEIKAPVSRVWRALTDHHEFGTWFRVRLDGPFVPGQVSRGQTTYPGYEHVRWEASSRKWSPNGCSRSPGILTRSTRTRIIPMSPLHSIPTGTLLRVVESGFDKLPSKRRPEAFRMNESGWSEQIKNLAEHVERAP